MFIPASCCLGMVVFPRNFIYKPRNLGRKMKPFWLIRIQWAETTNWLCYSWLFWRFWEVYPGCFPMKKKTSSDPKHILKISLEKRSMFFDDSEDDSMMKKKRRGSRKGTHSGSHCGFIYLVWFPIIIIICPLWIQVPPKKILKTPQIVP